MIVIRLHNAFGSVVVHYVLYRFVCAIQPLTDSRVRFAHFLPFLFVDAPLLPFAARVDALVAADGLPGGLPICGGSNFFTSLSGITQ
jgi:hypothetical protein